jgi:CheY-like chemotaxis protein
MGYDFSRMSCLLVEDNKFMRGVLRIVMESLGVRNYYFAQDGKEAVEIIQLRSGTLKAAGIGGIDCIISDVVMPGICCCVGSAGPNIRRIVSCRS